MRSPDNDTEGATRAETSAETDERQGVDTRRRWERRRASDKVATVALVVAILAVVIAAGTSAMALTNTVKLDDFRKAQAATEEEGRMRRDQSCVLFERAHLADVNQLRDTYRYLQEISPEDRKTALNQFILAQLPEVEQTARVDSAPKYCDEPGVGLPEPDPVVPPRPKALEGVGRAP